MSHKFSLAGNFFEYLAEILPQLPMHRLLAVLGNSHHMVFAFPTTVVYTRIAVHESLSFVNLSGSHLEALSFAPVNVKLW
jgi:hypothetical protein